MFGNINDETLIISYEEFQSLLFYLNNWDTLIAKGMLMSSLEYDFWYMEELSKYEMQKEYFETLNIN